MPGNADFIETVLLVPREGMGSAPPDLQMTLIDKYLGLLLESNSLPAAICFYAEGVKLTVEGSPVLERLREIESRGTHLIVCSTCVDYFGLRENVRAGVVGGMPDIIDAQLRAEKVITL